MNGEKMTNDTVEITLYPKKIPHIIGFSVCLLFTIVFIGLGITQGWPGYLMAGVSFCLTLITMFQILPGNSYLHIDSEGFTICISFRKNFISWSMVDEFFVDNRGPFVGFNFLPTCQKPPWADNKMFKRLFSCDFALPDNYGQNPEDLAALMNECLHAAKSADPNL